MKNFLSILATTVSGLVLIATLYLISQVLELRKSVDSLSESVDANTTQLETFSAQTESNTDIAANTSADDDDLESSSSSESQVSDRDRVISKTIKPGQFVSSGYDNQIKIELLSAKRVANQKTGAKDIVNVSLRVRRQVSKAKIAYLSLNRAKGRNPETNEDYRTITNKSTSLTSLNDLPDNAWANAYFWLKVPEGVDSLDIVIPETAIFKEVPISN